jgi:hypothetical protein
MGIAPRPISLIRRKQRPLLAGTLSLPKGTIVKLHLALCIAAFFGTLVPAAAQDMPPVSSSLRGLAPADEYFGRYNLSVLGIANHIRDAGARIDTGSDIRSMLTGPLAFATDAIKAWEQQYPSDPWIAKNLLALEAVYLKVPTDEWFRLASQTEAWLLADFPNTLYAAQGRKQLADAASPPSNQPMMMTALRPAIPSYATPWERFAAMRVPIGR